MAAAAEAVGLASKLWGWAKFGGAMVAFQGVSALGDAIVKAKNADSTAKDLCDTAAGLAKALKDMQANRTAIQEAGFDDAAALAQLKRYQSDAIVSQENLRRKRLAFYVRLAINVILGVMTVVIALFTIVRRSDALSERLARLEASAMRH